MGRHSWFRSVVAGLSLFFFANAEAAYAAGCGSVSPTGQHHHGGGCGFLGLGCVASAIGHAWDDTGGKVVHAIASAPWGRIGADAWGFTKGLVVGAAMGLAAAAVVGALIVTFPAWATALTVGGLVLGAAALGYGAYKTFVQRDAQGKNAWDRMGESDKFNLAGNFIGGFVGGGAGAALSRGAGAATAAVAADAPAGETAGAVMAAAPKLPEVVAPNPPPVLDAAAPPITTPPGQLPGSALTLNDLMDIAGGSKNYKDFIRTMTSRYQPDSWGSFYALHGDVTVTPDTPQVFITWGKATMAYAPQKYSEVFWNEGEESLNLQFVEEPDGHQSINAWKFDVNRGDGAAPMKPTPEHTLTPEQVKKMSFNDLVKNTNEYAKKGCLRCHLNVRRFLVEPDNHPRRLQMDPNWVFRSPADQAAVQNHFQGIWNQFVNGPARDNPLYRWMWEQPQVVARGGEILPEDTFTYPKFYRELTEKTGDQLLGALKREPKWGADRQAFAAAVQDAPDANAQLLKLGYTPEELAKLQNEVQLEQAQLNLAHIRGRDNESIAFLLADGKLNEADHFMNNNYLLLNQHSIEAIGPKILDMVVSDKQWEAMTPAEQATHVRLSDLNVKSMDELRSMVTKADVVANARRRANAYIVLRDILGNRSKATAYLSTAVRALSAETRNDQVDLMDVFANRLRAPHPSSINPYESIDTNPQPVSAAVPTAAKVPLAAKAPRVASAAVTGAEVAGGSDIKGMTCGDNTPRGNGPPRGGRTPPSWRQAGIGTTR